MGHQLKRVAGLIKKQDAPPQKNKTQLYASFKRFTSALKTHRPKMKGWKKIFQYRWKPQKAG